MRLFCLPDERISYFARRSETWMGVQLCDIDDDKRVAVVIGGCALSISEHADLGAESPQNGEGMWSPAPSEIVSDGGKSSFESWFRGLKEYGSGQAPFHTGQSPNLEMKLGGPSGGHPAMPTAPTAIYGHLPYHAVTEPDDVFYRCESFPISRRVDRRGNPPKVVPGTFAAPISELLFMSTGFAILGCYAIPSLPPARYRWEIQPAAGTSVRCGLSVPLYGYGGGGVEVAFPSGGDNRGPIANPVVLPPF
jgi:hypothetical protein